MWFKAFLGWHQPHSHRKKISEESFFIKPMEKLIKISAYFSYNSRNKPKITAIWRKLIQITHLNIHKNSKFCGILIFLITILRIPNAPPSLSSLEIQQARGLPGKHQEEIIRIGEHSKPYSQELSLFVLQVDSLEDITYKAVFIRPTLKLKKNEHPFFSWGCLSKGVPDN